MLPIKTVQTLSGLDQNTQFLQRNLQNAVNPVLVTPILDGNLLMAQKIQPDPTDTAGIKGVLTVGHGLGRTPKGYLVVASTAAYSQPYSVTSEQLLPDQQLYLHFLTGAGAVISLWVF
jgi:hypothetical protein